MSVRVCTAFGAVPLFAPTVSTYTPPVPAGSSQPHNNLPPYLVVNFIIALQGIFPPRR